MRRYYVQLTVQGFEVIDTAPHHDEPHTVAFSHSRFVAQKRCDELEEESRRASEPVPQLF